MKIFHCFIIGYLLGAVSPSALLSKIKKTDLREKNTKNLGATNTMLTFGKIYGVLVMVFDVTKAVIAVNYASAVFPKMTYSGLVAGCAAVVGHIFPFYLKFKGGKGLAAYGGMILAVDPKLFLMLLVITIFAMLTVNYSVAMPITASILFPVLYTLRTRSVIHMVLSFAISALIVLVHIPNIYRIKNGNGVKIREYIKNHLFS